MSTPTLVALRQALQKAEQFIAGFEDDATQQADVAPLLTDLRAQLALLAPLPEAAEPRTTGPQWSATGQFLRDHFAQVKLQRLMQTLSHLNAEAGTIGAGMLATIKGDADFLLAHAFGTRQAEAAQLDATNAAKGAIHHLLQRIQRDPSVAWHFDPITRSMEELTLAHALLQGLDVDQFRKDFFATLEFKEPRCAACRSAA
ncbi:hypothetical protein [Paracidovorax wautersii]|uniref:Uncharacterized protein n=1 Tax=Paracidovorax wautersii TaxID=1177982 RepID=A0A1I2GCW6_9BURK|nr:hypothetical protein [Paracidovorax wautersii]SFF15033.1 hypothetical protein SAMN04489711_11483 [Paracidovorax wautersii]